MNTQQNKKGKGAKMKTDASMIFNVLIKKDVDLYVAHCLELGIVAASKDLKEAKADVIALIIAQVDYAFSHDNLNHLYCPAPSEVWQEFYACKEQIENRVGIKSAFNQGRKTGKRFIPPWIIARTCTSFGPQFCHA
jgi:hypothetical protein